MEQGFEFPTDVIRVDMWHKKGKSHTKQTKPHQARILADLESNTFSVSDEEDNIMLVTRLDDVIGAIARMLADKDQEKDK